MSERIELASQRRLGAAALFLGLAMLVLDFAPAIWPGGAVAAACRRSLAMTCHQREERSLRLDGVALGSCARCVGLHAAGVVGGLVLLAAHPPRDRRLLLVGVAPLVADATAGATGAWDHPWLRVVSGVLFGASVLGMAAVRRRPGPP